MPKIHPNDKRVLRTLASQGIQLEPLEGIDWSSRGYVLDRDGHIAGLGLYECEVSDVSPLSGLAQLQEILLNDTQVRDLSPLSGLTQLQTLDLRDTPIETLPPWILTSKMGIQWKNSWSPTKDKGHIILYDNPLKSPPVEIVKQGKEAIRQYFLSKDKAL